MKRILFLVVLLITLIAPSFALQSEPTQISELNAAQVTLTKATEALTASPKDAALKVAVEQAQASLETTLNSAVAKRDSLKETDPTAYDALNNAIGEVDSKRKQGKVGLSFVQESVEKMQVFLKENGMAYIMKALMFLLIVLLFKLLSKVAAKLTLKALSSNKLQLSALLKKFFVGIINKVVFFAGILIALGSIGVDTGPILAGAGVIGFVVGFALQNTLSNFAAGIMILMYRPFDVGDVITAAGETGKVSDLTLVSTTLLTGDNQKLIVPNSSIWGSTIRNITAQETRRIDFTIGVGYDDDLDKVQAVLLEVASAHELVLLDKGVQVEAHTLGESSVDFIVRPWTKSGDYWTVYFDLTKAFKKRLDAEGFSIPYPQRDLHIVSAPEGVLQGK
ncbi:MAG: small conductance mechanosensitive channel [Glaciecola sp.]|jgi:small conductance mechanosensitive channel